MGWRNTLGSAYVRMEERMNKPTVVGSVTILLGVGIAAATDPCGVVTHKAFCSAGYGDGTHCYQPSTGNDTCLGVATNFCTSTTLTCNASLLSFNLKDGQCYPTGPCNYTYVTYNQGGPCIATIPPITIPPGG